MNLLTLRKWLIVLVVVWLALLLFGIGMAVRKQDSMLQNSQNMVSLRNLSTATHAKMVVVVTGLKGNKALFSEILKFPQEVALGFVPSDENAETAAEAEALLALGHDILVNMHLEHNPHVASPGSYSLLNHFPVEENLRRLDFLLKKYKNIIGVYSHDKPINHMQAIIDVLAQQKLCYLTSAASDIQYALMSNAVIHLLEKDLSAPLALAERIAQQDGMSIVLLELDAYNVSQIHAWLKTLASKHITLVPLHQLLQNNYI